MIPRLLLALALTACLPVAVKAQNATSHQLRHDGIERQWSEVVPPACTGRGQACPVILLLHGGRGQANQQLARMGRNPRPAVDGASFARGTGMDRATANARMILIVPECVDGNWNDGRAGIADGIDDVGFLRAVIADVASRASVDRTRVFATGVSNGGLMSYRLACEAGDLVRGVAAVVANLGETLAARCAPTVKVSVLQIVGGQDPLMPIGGGGLGGRAGGTRGGVMSAANTYAFWKGRLGSGQETPLRTSDDVTTRSFVAGPDRVTQVVLTSFGHGWPESGGGAAAAGGVMARIRGQNPSGYNATDAIIAFFADLPTR